ncbi:hypothetical protein ABLW00_06195 [Staphylococcus equorum]
MNYKQFDVQHKENTQVYITFEIVKETWLEIHRYYNIHVIENYDEHYLIVTFKMARFEAIQLCFLYRSNIRIITPPDLKDEAIEMDGYKISYNENSGEYQGQLRIPMCVENLKNKDNSINPDKTFKLIADGKEAKMESFSNDSKYLKISFIKLKVILNLINYEFMIVNF